ncbi:MAG TPA: polysaccharide biosynthesis tyrosine autokinase, partial [Candidatus Polarisedimenticolia bacterium]|nr:polysaccharide biosynthesis tyrosine autokinase [Candidatus Polarisedimenticolia bacterium]
MSAQYDLNLQDYLRILRRRWKVVAGCCLALGLLTLVLTPRIRPVYEAAARVKWTRSDSITGLFLEAFTWSPGDDLATQAQIVMSKPIALKAAQRLGLLPADATVDTVLRDRAQAAKLDALQQEYSARPIDNTSLIEIRSACDTPEQAVRVANAVMQEYIIRHTFERNRQAIEAREFVERQVAEVSARLDSAEERLTRFKEKNVGASMPDAKEVQFFQDEAARTEARITALQGLATVLDAPGDPGATPDLLLVDLPEEGLAELRQELVKLEDQKRQLLAFQRDDAPEVVSVTDRIDRLLSRLRNETRTALTLQQTRKRELDRKLERFPRTEQTLLQLQRDVQVSTEAYEMLMRKHQEALIKEADKVQELSVVETATRAVPRKQPGRTLRSFIGLLVGLLLGLVGAFVVESLDTSIGSIEDVEQYLGLSVIGVVPHIEPEAVRREILQRSPALAADPSVEGLATLVTQFSPQSPVAEAFRSLRTNLEFSRIGRAGRTFLFTSASPSEGKSTTVANLGVAMAQMGKKTLIWDCDLRSPAIGRIFGVPREPGFTHVVLGMSRLEDVVHRFSEVFLGRADMRSMLTSAGIENLHILTAGALPPNPSELLASPLFSDFVVEVASRFDVILIDAPPVLPVTDAVLLSTRVDGVVLVYQLGRIGRAVLKRAKTHLDNVRAAIRGIVLNDIKAEVSTYTPEMQYIYHRYERTPREPGGGTEEGPGAPRAAAGGGL